jgi:methionine biosynthesis protein MetW
MTDELKYTQLNSDPLQAHSLVLQLTNGFKRVLEVGAATGYLSEAISKQGSMVVSVEIDPRAAAIAAQRGLDVRVGSLSTTLRDDEMFDCVVMADVIEHVQDPDRLIADIKRHIAPGAAIVVSVPNIAHWSIRSRLLFGRFDYTPTGLMDETHVKFYTVRSLEALLARNGLRIEQRRYSIGPVSGDPRRWRRFWYKKRAIARLASALPGLFAFQFVWRVSLLPEQHG